MKQIEQNRNFPKKGPEFTLGKSYSAQNINLKSPFVLEEASPSTTDILDTSAVLFPVGIYSSDHTLNPLVIERREGSLPVIPKVLNRRNFLDKNKFAWEQLAKSKVEICKSK